MSYTVINDYSAIVIGSGAAGYATACRIKEMGRRSVCIVTEGVKLGTSRNTGSDKQTYYKLGLAGDTPDSVRGMADTFFSGGCVDGDNALCEAALSARCFSYLCEAGVPFPHNAYGEYVGYKTDHDPFARATSAGPLTSKFMTEALEKKAEFLGITVFNGLMAVEILKNENGACGVLCADMNTGEFTVFKSEYTVIATGGPAGIYKDSVYPICHHGSSALALRAGAPMQNMTEWQYGLASLNPRWNVSGTYMQVLPRFVSIDADGVEREFLSELYDDKNEALSAIFMKGYQWPFDVKKAMYGSSVIDLLVYRETVLRGRRVYIDFTKNPFGLVKIDFEKLSVEAYGYLNSVGACFGTPIQRLEKMNRPAIELYRSKGVDISECYLEIALCAQHNNGGIAVDSDWQTGVKNLFAVGECAGTHGIVRPGGSALNAGQVGALRAATCISDREGTSCTSVEFSEIAERAVKENTDFCSFALALGGNSARLTINEAREKMSACAAAIRSCDGMKNYIVTVKKQLSEFSMRFGIESISDINLLYNLRDTLTVQLVALVAMVDYAENVGVSRGSALYTDSKGEKADGLEEIFRFNVEGLEKTAGMIQTVELNGNEVVTSWRSVRPIPDFDSVFENVWREYRERREKP